MRSEGVVRLRLAGLDDGEVAEFVRLVTGAEADREVTEAIVDLTAGNAFLLTELWRELIQSQAIEVGATAVRLARPLGDIATPETVRDVVTQRLTRVAPATGEVLELGALIGGEFELGTVRRAAGLEEAALLDAVDEAVRSGLVVEAPGRGLAYRFAHELVRRAVSDRLSASRRAEIHLRVAHALEGGAVARATREAGSPRSRTTTPKRRRWAAPSVPSSTACSPPQSATAALAFDEAVERLRTALALGVDEPRERGTVSLELGYACHRAGRSTDALGAFRETASIARALGDSELLARAAIGFEEACWRPAIHDEGAVELLEEAAAALGTEPSELRVRLLGALTRALDFKGELTEAVAARDEAIAMARSRGDRAALGLGALGRLLVARREHARGDQRDARRGGRDRRGAGRHGDPRRGAMVAGALIRGALRPRCGPRRARPALRPGATAQRAVPPARRGALRVGAGALRRRPCPRGGRRPEVARVEPPADRP